ncbi:unnamed protein product, partial [Mesorhabditis spiculigera]
MGNAVAYKRNVTKQQNRKKQLEHCLKSRERVCFNNNLDPIDLKRLDRGENHAGTSADSYVRLSVGGKSYCVRTELYTPEETRMHRFVASGHEERLQLCDGYDPATGEYYFERNSKLADHLMDYFATGSLHRPSNVCIERFKEELLFWEIGLDQMAACCTIITPPDPSLLAAKKKGMIAVPDDDFEPIFDGVLLGRFRLTLWRFLEDPQSSIPAAVFALLSVMFVFASGPAAHKFAAAMENPLYPNFVYRATDNPMAFLVMLEYICIAWFTFEYAVRLLVYPKRWEFVRKTLNLIDLLTILPFYMELCLPLAGVHSGKLKDLTGAMLVIRVLRVLRMARVFKLARYSTSLQTFGHTLRSSITELSMLSMFLLTGIVFFSTIMYYLERDEPNTDFYSIPAGCWWCVVTMATVGYGDAKPVTTAGKLVATTTSICGIIVLAFPISMIVEKFASAQQKAIEDTQLAQAQMSAAANNALLRRFPTRRRPRAKRPSDARHDSLLSTVA